ncbi:MAG: hypothetical protein H6648_08720 [Caldilineae bacterium]|nr:hypothetical protein [Caldilineae bacterium]
MSFAPEDYSLEVVLDAMAAAIDGVYPDLVVTAAGVPDCAMAALVRPTSSDEPDPRNDCVRVVRGVVGLYAFLSQCTIEEAQRHIYRMTSGCGPSSILARLRERPLTALQAAGVSLRSVGPATGYGLTQFQTEGAPNTYHASIAWEAIYQTC